jgi:fucose permease
MGMTGMRILLGSILRSLPLKKILAFSFTLILAGLILLRFVDLFSISVVGLVLLGAGLAGGFPIMLGIAGSRYPEISGTVFSLILFIALIGNFLINYGMGIIAQNFGIQNLITVAFAEAVIMILFCFLILRNIKDKN